jgi:hypothetical protein
LISVDELSQELQQFRPHQHVLYDQRGASNPCDLLEHLRAQQVKFHQREYRALQHLLQRVQHLLSP